MVITSSQDLRAMQIIGRIVALALAEMRENVRPGITTAELDRIGEAVLIKHKANSAPRVVYDYPGATCISINNQAAHGIPGNRVIKAGDLVNIDVSAELNGYYSDTAATIPVEPVSEQARRLMACTMEAHAKAMAAAQAGRPLSGIGSAVQSTASAYGFNVIPALPGHGIGHTLHEKPTVLNFYHASNEDEFLQDGLVITVEPFITTGSGKIYEASDGWTLLTVDDGLVAQYEHTIMVTEGEPVIFTQL